MQLTLSELAALTGGQFASEPSQESQALILRGVASIGEAAPDEVTFLGNPKYAPALRTSRAAVALVPLDFAETVPPLVLRVENPSVSFALLVDRFAPPPPTFSPGVHPSAVVAADAQIGENVSIQPGVVVEAGAVIGAGSVIGALSYIGHGAVLGADCRLHARVTVATGSQIGSRVILHSGAVVGSDGFGFEVVEGRRMKIPQAGIVQIDDDVEIGANTTIDRARFGKTWIGEGTKIDNLVQIAHNVTIGKHCVIVSQVGISGSTRIGDWVTLAGQVGIAGHLEIGSQVVVGAQSGVSKSLPASEFYIGSPAIPGKKFKEQIGMIHRLPRLTDRVRRLEQLSGENADSSPSEA